MTELKTDLGLRIGMDEIDDSLPRGDVLVAPHAGAPGADPAFRRHASHLGEHEAGAAEGTLAEMYEMEVVGRSVHGRIHRHGRDGDAVFDRHVTHGERRKHRWRGLVR